MIAASVTLLTAGSWALPPASSAVAAPAAAGGTALPQEVVDVDLGAVYWYDEYKNTLTLQNNCNKTERVQIELPWGGTADNNLPGMWLWLDGSPMGFRVWHYLPPKSSKRLDQASYADAFVEHTRRNLEQRGGDWSSQMEEAVRGVVPNRWQDITRILQAAGGQ